MPGAEKENVTQQFYYLCVAGAFVGVLQAIMCYILSQDVQTMLRYRCLQHLTNFLHIVWFVALVYFRFKPTGRACSGDYIQGVKPDNFGKLYIWEQGRWMLVYVIL